VKKSEELIRKELMSICHLVYLRGMVNGSGGNISVRMQDGMLITPTGRSLGQLRADDLVRVGLNGQFSGDVKPSKEVYLHLNCYEQREDVNAVVHVHSPYTVAASCLDNADLDCVMPSFTPGYLARVNKLQMIPYFKPGSLELAKRVRSAIKFTNSVVLANHGIVAVGKDLEGALNIAEEVEGNAKIYLLVGKRGKTLN